MALSKDELETLMAQGFPEGDVKIEDVRGDGEVYSVFVCDAGFEGKSRVQQHQMVYQAMQGKAGTDIHALQIHTSIPKS